MTGQRQPAERWFVVCADHVSGHGSEQAAIARVEHIADLGACELTHEIRHGRRAA